MNGWVLLLWSTLAAAVLIAGGIFGSMLMSGKISFAPEAEPTVVPSPEQTGVIDTSFGVMVLNATPESGLAAGIRDTIVNAGWPAANVLASNANTQDFATTTVYYAAPEDEQAAIGLARLIGGAAVAQTEAHAVQVAEGLKQLTVVIGLDRAPAAAPEPEAPEGTTDDSTE